MNKITTEITEIKTTVSMEQWQQWIMDCQQSGMSIKAWCRENGVATSSYYHYLRKIRESVLQEKQIVPLELSKPANCHANGPAGTQFPVTERHNPGPQNVVISGQFFHNPL